MPLGMNIISVFTSCCGHLKSTTTTFFSYNDPTSYSSFLHCKSACILMSPDLFLVCELVIDLATPRLARLLQVILMRCTFDAVVFPIANLPQEYV